MSNPPAGSEGRRVRRGVLTAYGVIVLVGTAFLVGSFQYDFYRNVDQVGPGYLPRFAGAFLVILGVLLLIQEIRVGSQLGGDSGIAQASGALNRSTVIKLVTVFGLITVALLLVPVLGLIVSLVLLIPALTIGVERMPVGRSLILTLGAGVIAYLLFIVVLSVPLPMGILGGLLR